MSTARWSLICGVVYGVVVAAILVIGRGSPGPVASALVTPAALPVLLVASAVDVDPVDLLLLVPFAGMLEGSFAGIAASLLCRWATSRRRAAPAHG